jgi:hypothetical protein
MSVSDAAVVRQAVGLGPFLKTDSADLRTYARAREMAWFNCEGTVLSGTRRELLSKFLMLRRLAEVEFKKGLCTIHHYRFSDKNLNCGKKFNANRVRCLN